MQELNSMKPSRKRLHDLISDTAGVQIERQRVVGLIRARLQELQGEPRTRERSLELQLLLNRIDDAH
jgi:hypothetical protein